MEQNESDTKTSCINRLIPLTKVSRQIQWGKYSFPGNGIQTTAEKKSTQVISSPKY